MDDELPRVAKEKMDAFKRLKKKGVDPFGYSFDASHTCHDVLADFEALEGDTVSVRGRIRSMREHGALVFIDLEDASGTVQLFLQEDDFSEHRWDSIGLLARGDIIGVEGTVGKTDRGEESVFVEEVEVLAKALRDLPPESEGLQDREKRYRRRYLDMLANREVRDVFVTRHHIVRAMRDFLNGRGFVEIETPILQEIYGGAMARPFKTEHHTLDRKFYLRIADELYLKRLIVGGFEKVYEVGKDFRNEGIDTTHNPEFTLMEFYQAYADYKDVMNIAEAMVAHIAKEVLGTTTLEYGGHTINLSPPWNRISMVDALKEYEDIDVTEADRDDLVAVAEEHGLEVIEEATWGELVAGLFEELVEEQLIEPTFVYDYPVDVSPLAKRKRGDDRFTERFEIFIAGEEFGNAYSELNDPIEQFERFKDQVEKRKKGDVEAHEMDKDYVRALEYGMPPTGGFGIGIDRLTMLFTGKESIKEVIAFPQLAEAEQDIRLHSDVVKDRVFKDEG